MRRIREEVTAFALVMVIGLMMLGGCEVAKDRQAQNNAAADAIWSVR